MVGADWNSTNVYDGGLFYEASTKKSSRDGFTLQISERGIVVNTSRKGKTISAETYELPKSFRELGLTIELIRQKHKVEILLH